MSAKLLTEYVPLEYDSGIIQEAMNRPNGTIRFPAVLQRANAKNQNGRVYPRHILEREVNEYHKEFVEQRRALGELDHPSDTVVNLRNVCINVVEMSWKGDELVGIVEVLSTPAGNIVKELMKNNIRLGISSRGVGSVTSSSQGTDQVEDDYKLICFDVVSNPSTQGAFLSENVSHALRNTRIDRINDLVVEFFGELGDNR